MGYSQIQKLLGASSESLLKHTCKTVSKDKLHIPGPDWVDRIFSVSDRNIRVLKLAGAFWGWQIGEHGISFSVACGSRN